MADTFSPVFSSSAPASKLANALHKILLASLAYQEIFQKTNDQETAILRVVESMISSLPADDREDIHANAGGSTSLTFKPGSPSIPSIQLPMTITMPMDIETPELVGTLYIGSDGYAKLREGSARPDAFQNSKWTRSRKMDYCTTVDSVGGVRTTRLVCTINERTRPHPTHVYQNVLRHRSNQHTDNPVNLGSDLVLDTVGKEAMPIGSQCELERYSESRRCEPGELQRPNMNTYNTEELDVRRPTRQPLKRGMDIYHAPELNRHRSTSEPIQPCLDIHTPQIKKHRRPRRNFYRNTSLDGSSSSASSASTPRVHFSEYLKEYRYQSSTDISSSDHLYSADARSLRSVLIQPNSPITMSKADSAPAPATQAEARSSLSKRKRDDHDEDNDSTLEHPRKKQQFFVASDMLSGYPRSIWNGIQRLYSRLNDAESASLARTSTEPLD